jgi:hypothetical protein
MDYELWGILNFKRRKIKYSFFKKINKNSYRYVNQVNLEFKIQN